MLYQKDALSRVAGNYNQYSGIPVAHTAAESSQSSVPSHRRRLASRASVSSLAPIGREVSDMSKRGIRAMPAARDRVLPGALQMLATWKRPAASMERLRQRYGKRVTVQLPFQPPFVILSDPGDIKDLFMASPEALHPGEGARILEPIVGRNSVILLDEAPHLEQRKLLLPAFHGEKMQRLTGLMTELAEREIDAGRRTSRSSFIPACSA